MGKKVKRKFIPLTLDSERFSQSTSSTSISKQSIGSDVNIRNERSNSYARPNKSDATSSSYRNVEGRALHSEPIRNPDIPEVSEELKNKLVTNCNLQNETISQNSENVSQEHFVTTPSGVWNTKELHWNNPVSVTSQILNQGHGCNPPLGHNIKPAQQNVVIHNMEPGDLANVSSNPLEPQHTNLSDVINQGASLNVQANEFVPRPHEKNSDNRDPSEISGHTTNAVQLSSGPPDMKHKLQLQQTEIKQWPSDQQQSYDSRSFTGHSDSNHGNLRGKKYKQHHDDHYDRTHRDHNKNRGKRDRSEPRNHYRHSTSQSNNFGPSRDSYVQNSQQPDTVESWEDYEQESETAVTEDVQKVHDELESEASNPWKNTKNSRSLKKDKPSPISSEQKYSRGCQSEGKSLDNWDDDMNTSNVGSAEKNKGSFNKQKQPSVIRKHKDPRFEGERKSLDTSRESQQSDNSYSFNSSRKSTDSSRLDKSNRDIYNRSYEEADKEYIQFEEEYKRNPKIDPVKVKEIDKDLFAMSTEYSLGHCVAEDMRMGSGIAVNFRREFKHVEELLDQRQKQGGLAYLEFNKRFIYYLVTKRESTGKPTYQTFWSSLKKMRDHIIKNKVEKLAIPRIGCGLDRLEWSKVRFMLDFLFRDVDVEITVCNFQQMEDSSPQKNYLSNKLVNGNKSLVEIEEHTIILYTASEDSHISEEMKNLAKKFNILPEFKKSPKQLGKPIRHVIGNYILYGCVVRKTEEALFDFSAFGKCLFEINKNNKKDLFEYVALQAVYDDTDYLLHEKIITLLRFHLKHVDIHICPAVKDDEEKQQWRSQ